MANTISTKNTARETAERIRLQRRNEENARRVLASTCNSKTVLDERTEELTRRAFFDKYYYAVKKQKEKFYLSPREYGWLLRRYREKAGFSVQDLYRRTHISEWSIDQYEDGHTAPEEENRKTLENELHFPKGMAFFFVDESHNYLCGQRNYAPVVYDACAAGHDNAEMMQQGLRYVMKFCGALALAMVVAALSMALYILSGTATAKYCALGGVGTATIVFLFTLVLLATLMRRQNMVKEAFANVADSLWKEQE